MIIVATVALSTMISNDLVMPVLLRLRSCGLAERRRPAAPDAADPPRRASCCCCCSATSSSGWSANQLRAGQHRPDRRSARVAQFAPPIVAGIYWKEANLRGALPGLGGGFAVWLYTLVLPTLAQLGLVDAGFVDDGPFGIGAAAAAGAVRARRAGSGQPRAGLEPGRSTSAPGRAGGAARPAERRSSALQAVLFVDVDQRGGAAATVARRGAGRRACGRCWSAFSAGERAERCSRRCCAGAAARWPPTRTADADLVQLRRAPAGPARSARPRRG